MTRVAPLRQVGTSVTLDARGGWAMVNRGVLAGLTAFGPVPVLRPDDTDLTFHTGRLAGSLEAGFIRALGAIDLDMTEVLYAYAAGLATSWAQSALGKPQPEAILRADALARYYVREIRSLTLEDADALVCFEWLADQLAVPVTTELLDSREHLLVRPAKADAG